MAIANLTREVGRLRQMLTAQSPRGCPACRHWPSVIQLRIAEEIIEPGQVIPPPDPNEPRPGEFGPCEQCGRTHKAMVVAIVRDDNFYGNKDRLADLAEVSQQQDM